MSKTLQVRNVDDEIYRAIELRASEQGMTMPAFLKREIGRLAALQSSADAMSMKEWLESTRHQQQSDITPEEIVEALDESRGPWPNPVL